MLFANATTDTQHPRTVERTFGRRKYSCAPGATVEIPDIYAAAIKREGTLLIPADEASKPKQRRPCIEEFVHAGYKKETYDTRFPEEEGWGPGWSNPDWRPPTRAQLVEAEKSPEKATQPPKATEPETTAPNAGDIDPAFAPKPTSQPPQQSSQQNKQQQRR